MGRTLKCNVRMLNQNMLAWILQTGHENPAVALGQHDVNAEALCVLHIETVTYRCPVKKDREMIGVRCTGGRKIFQTFSSNVKLKELQGYHRVLF